MNQSVLQRIREQYMKDKAAAPKRRDFFKVTYVPYGKIIGRVLPKHPDQMLTYFPIGRHFNLTKYPPLCPTLTTGILDTQEPCPVCELSTGLLNSNDKEEQELGRTLRVSPRYLWYFIIRKVIHKDGRVEVPPQDPVILELPPTAHNALLSKYFIKSTVGLDTPLDVEINEEEAFMFDDPDNGVDVIITKTDSTPVKYTVDLDPSGPSPLGTEEDVVRWLEDIKNLDEYVPAQLESYQKLESLIVGGESQGGGVSEPEDGEDNVPFDTKPEPAPAPAPAAPTPAKRNKPAKSGSLADIVAKNMASRGKK